MELGESMEDTARREVFEETGLCLGELKLIDIFSGSDNFVTAQNGDEFYCVTAAYYILSHGRSSDVDIIKSNLEFAMGLPKEL